MSLKHCPHCGAENFTMEGWEDLDHCSSCGKPLGDLEADSAQSRAEPARGGAARWRSGGRDACSAKRPRPA
jgi:hypothetical protein